MRQTLTDRQIIKRTAGVFNYDAEGLKTKNLKLYIFETYDRKVSSQQIQNVLGSLATRYEDLCKPGAERIAAQFLEQCGNNLTVANVILDRVHFTTPYKR